MEPLSFLATSPGVLEELLHGADAVLRRHPEGDNWHLHGHHVRWSLVQHACHLRDLEREGYGARLERLALEVRSFFPDVDGDQLAAERDYDAQDAFQACAAFRTARAASLHTARTLLAAGKNPAGTMEGVGDVALERLLEFMVEHDRGHLDMMRRLRAHWE